MSYKNNYFSKPHTNKNKIEFELDLFSYAKKSDLKNAAQHVLIHHNLPKKDNLANLKSEVDKLDIGKLETTGIGLSKLSDLVKKEVVKKTKYDELVKIFISIKTADTSSLVEKSDYNTKIGEIEKNAPDHSKYITTPEFNKIAAVNFAARLAEAKLATKNDIANFVEKTDFDDKLKKNNKKILVENELNELSEKVQLLPAKR